MNSDVLVYGFLIFFICLIIHIIIWRIKRPANDAIVLLLIFVIIPVSAFISLALSDCNLSFISLQPMGMIAALFLHLSISSAYIASYPAAQADSPTLRILLIVASAMPKGLAMEDLAKYFDDARLVLERFEDLMNSNLVMEKQGIFILTGRAEFIVKFFVLYRKILGLPVGGG